MYFRVAALKNPPSSSLQAQLDNFVRKLRDNLRGALKLAVKENLWSKEQQLRNKQKRFKAVCKSSTRTDIVKPFITKNLMIFGCHFDRNATVSN
ncbi:8c46bffa-9ad4-4825-9c89-3b9de6ed506f [Sclerotinia trifoliorum]|uniref:8c46bffa-9ad4-4825-9c89-3b9de6ed506f n=1 Tax=Sclerotinia trifoliorum TaxID=28548 RepID=A0A8H2VTU4_9HELO|nr:8c46bffa-9ad4-4825-9c89-3b9de6ed506f [Sclerotinia trifoliorum]